MRILFMGTPDFAVPSLEALVAAGHEVVGVFSQPDKPKNRGMKLQPTPVKCCAQAHGLAVFQPTKLRDGTALETIVRAGARPHRGGGLRPDFAPGDSVLSPAWGASTCTPPCCPSTGGRPPFNWAILNGETGDRGDHHAHGSGAGRRGYHCPAGHPH